MVSRRGNAPHNSLRRYAAIATAFAGFLWTGPLRAEDIPSYKTLFCEQNCPVFVPAAPIDQPKPYYPIRDTGSAGLYVEAQVDVRYTIGADGGVKEAAIENLIGPQEFADSALSAVRSYKFRPATESGQPVEENRRVRFEFYVQDSEKAGRPEVGNAYNVAIREDRDNKPDVAIAALKAIIGEQRLNFYERTTVSYALAEIYVEQKNYPAALDAIRAATLLDGGFLAPATRQDAIRLHIRVAAAAGELSEAFLWLDTLKARNPVDDDDPDAKLIAKLHATLNSNAPLSSVAAIAPDGTPWHHTMLRRSFEFSNITGTLKGFALRCERHGIESAISDKADWTVPASWSGCEIYVSGDPGAKFQFLEAVPAARGDQGKPAPKG
jgi:TonB family protein